MFAMGFFFDVPYTLHVCLAVLPIIVLSHVEPVYVKYQGGCCHTV